MSNCCIYLIINRLNNKFYLGSTNHFNKRKNAHFLELKRNKHHSAYLQNSVNKYGIENFEMVIYQFCSKDEKLELENYYLQTLKPHYNVSKSAFAPMEGRKHSKETKEKFKNKPRVRGESHWLYGKKLSPEHKEKLVLKKVGSKRNNKTKKKMSETAKRLNSISRIDRTLSYKKIKDNKGNVFINLGEASEFHNISRQAICDILKGRTMATKLGVMFKYFDDETSFQEISEIRKKSKLKLLSEEKLNQIREIKKDIKLGLSNEEIKEKHKITKTTLNQIKNGKNYWYV